MFGWRSQRAIARRMNDCSRARIASAPTASFSANTSPARIDSTMAGVPPSSRCSMSDEIAVLGRIDVGDRAAAGNRGDAVAEELPARHEDARRSRPADELVRRDEDRVLVGERIGLAPLRRRRERPHLDRDVRRRRREIPERQGAVPVQQDRDRADVADDAGDVRRRREGADLQRPVRVGDELRLEAREVDPSVVVLRDHHDIRQRLAPGQLVAVVLVGADEDDRARRDGDRRPQVVAIVEARPGAGSRDSR